MHVFTISSDARIIKCSPSVCVCVYHIVNSIFVDFMPPPATADPHQVCVSVLLFIRSLPLGGRTQGACYFSLHIHLGTGSHSPTRTPRNSHATFCSFDKLSQMSINGRRCVVIFDFWLVNSPPNGCCHYHCASVGRTPKPRSNHLNFCTSAFDLANLVTSPPSGHIPGHVGCLLVNNVVITGPCFEFGKFCRRSTIEKVH